MPHFVISEHAAANCTSCIGWYNRLPTCFQRMVATALLNCIHPAAPVAACSQEATQQQGPDANLLNPTRQQMPCMSFCCCTELAHKPNLIMAMLLTEMLLRTCQILLPPLPACGAFCSACSRCLPQFHVHAGLSTTEQSGGVPA